MTDDPIAEFFKRGGRIEAYPTADGSGVIRAADRKRLAEHREERKEKATFRWAIKKRTAAF